MKASSKMRSCICKARQAVDARMQSVSFRNAILDCVQHSPVAKLYAALVSLSFNSPPQTFSSTHLRPTIGTTNFPPLPDTSFQGDEAMSLPSNSAVLTQGNQ
uniref:Ground-like domain-containing protein n=1 Tax=Meloidogyne hapla TaxID=6305 RepID=A0A1I8BF04_MELHA